MSSHSELLPSGPVARRAARAVVWNYGAWLGGKLVLLVATAILARLLSPTEFGLVGLATVAVTYLGLVQDIGLGGALIHRRRDVTAAANTVFTLNLALGAVLTAVVFALAPSVAGFFDEPQVTPLLRALSATFILNALSSTHVALLARGLEFARKAVPDVGRVIVQGGVSITLAVTGAGAWSLVLGQLAGASASVVLAWAVSRWRPSIDFRPRLARSLSRYGGSLLVADVTHAIVAGLDYLVVGKVLGSTALGIYVLAYRLPELLLLGLVTVLSKVVFPAMAEVQHRVVALRRGLLTTARYVPMVVLPIGLGLIIAAEPIVLAVLGEEWIDAIPIMRLVAASALISTLMTADGDVYKACGRPDLLARFAVIKVALFVPALLVGVQFGLAGVAAAHLLSTIVVKWLRAVAVARLLELQMRDLLEQLRPALPAAAALTAAALPALFVTGTLEPWPRLAVVASAGAIAYFMVLLRQEGARLREVLRIFRPSDQGKAETVRYSEHGSDAR